MKTKTKGFTLVELVITIAIVIILSVVSVPIYRGYTRQAKMAEAYALLGTIFSSQKAYFSQYSSFLHCSHGSARGSAWTCNDEVLGVDARGNKYCTWFMIGGYGNLVDHKFDCQVLLPEELSMGTKSVLKLYYCLTEQGGAVYSQI